MCMFTHLQLDTLPAVCYDVQYAPPLFTLRCGLVATWFAVSGRVAYAYALLLSSCDRSHRRNFVGFPCILSR